MNIHFVDTPLLRVGYEDHNPGGARTVVLLHGWPDSIRTWARVAPQLVAAGWRVIVPALRGFSPTTFLRADTPRTGQLATLGRDLVDFVNALGLQQPALVGHDWGARAAANACGLSPGIASHLAMLSVGYGTNTPEQKLTMEQTRLYWYHWFMATERGRRVVAEDRRGFAKIMWDTWAPAGWYDPAEFEATAAAFDNDDWVPITLHSYSQRWAHAPSDPAYAADDAALTPAPVLSVPTLMLHGEADGVTLPVTSANKEAFFRGPYLRKLLPGVGHFPQREAPDVVAQHLLDFLGRAN
ncbi:MAG: alpha/beta hydrolase [Betaproteobacteria bacterium]|nr:alpha/beta hydrolase [Betaproteobacteria bacterium]